MNLSPNDIRNYEFPSQMRGYDKEEVDSFLDQIANALESIKQESLKLSMENDSIKSQLDNLKQFEDSIKGAAIDARQNADSTMANAKEEAEKILAEAKEKANGLVSSKEAKVSEYKQQLNRLEQTKESFSTELKDMIHIHLRMIEKIADAEFSYTSETAEEIEVTNSSEVERDQMTSVGSESKNEQIITEETNAADEIVPVSEDTPVDPELAAALSGFDHHDNVPEKVSPDTMIGSDDVPKQGALVETTKRAEDVPEGFVVGGTIVESKDTSSDENSTDKLHLAPDAQDSACEHNAISVDEEKVDSENILEELDSVAAKFEEEMNKAEAK